MIVAAMDASHRPGKLVVLACPDNILEVLPLTELYLNCVEESALRVVIWQGRSLARGRYARLSIPILLLPSSSDHQIFTTMSRTMKQP